MLFDRGHIGEYVYSPLYRNYSGEYVFDLEKEINTDDIRLVILKGDLDAVKDDGLSHDYSRRFEEQERFLKGFEMSIIEDKRIVEVHKQNTFRDLGHIIGDILL